MVRYLSIIACALLFMSASISVDAQEHVVVSAKPRQTEKAKVSGYERIGDALYEVIYEYRIQTDVSDTYSTILQFGTEQSRFLDYLAYRVDSLANAGAPEDLIAKANNDADRSAFYFEPVTFTYSENMAHEWTFGNGQKEICGYPCKEAKTSYGGREWTVWFAPSIPSNAGPWKLGGLPGLIMEAQDAEGIHHFTATALRKAACPIVRVQDAGRDKTQRDRFIQRKNASGGNSLNNIPTESITSISVFKNDNGGTIKVNGRVTVRITNHTWVPLELE